MKNSDKPIVEHVPDFLDWIDVERGLSSKSQENYSRFLRKFLVWLKKEGLEDLKPHELSPAHLWEYRVFLARTHHGSQEKSLKKSTQNYYLIALRSLLNYFAERDITSLPSEKVKLARGKGDPDVRFLVLDQVERLLEAPDTNTLAGLRDRALLETLFSTGMRVSELTALNREQVKVKETLVRQAHHEGEDMELGIVGKGGRARTVYLSQRTLKALKAYLDARDDMEQPLFINYRSLIGASRRLTPRSAQNLIKKYVILAGLPITTTPHVLRHSFATDLLAKGVDIKILQEFLGHKNIAATQIYAHVTSKQLRDIHRKFHGSNTSPQDGSNGSEQ
ncbi:MAG: tyrosine-type recombinase/integrase [Candidatus Spechtbacterales bacterium]